MRELGALQALFGAGLEAGSPDQDALQIFHGEPEQARHRFGIYRGNAAANVAKALAATYPVVEKIVGPEFFAGLAREYRSRHPSQHGDLNEYGHAFAGSYGMQVTALRFSNVYGPRSYRKGSAVAHFFKQVLDGKPITVYGDGTQVRDLVFVGDLCRGILQALRKQKHLLTRTNVNVTTPLSLWYMIFEGLVWPAMNIFANVFFVWIALIYGMTKLLVMW